MRGAGPEMQDHILFQDVFGVIAVFRFLNRVGHVLLH